MVEVMENIDQIVSVNIVVRMRDLNMSQKTLAQLAGMTPVHLNKLLKKKRPISKSPKLKDLARALHCEEFELYQKSDFETPAKYTALSESYIRLKELNAKLVEQISDAIEAVKEERKLRLAIPTDLFNIIVDLNESQMSSLRGFLISLVGGNTHVAKKKKGPSQR